jgi:hypothetical protein
MALVVLVYLFAIQESFLIYIHMLITITSVCPVCSCLFLSGNFFIFMWHFVTGFGADGHTASIGDRPC